MHPTGNVDADTCDQILLDMKIIVLDRTVVTKGSGIGFSIVGGERFQDRTCRRCFDDAGLGQHDHMGTVDPSRHLREMLDGLFKERLEHGFGVDGGREMIVIGFH